MNDSKAKTEAPPKPSVRIKAIDLSFADVISYDGGLWSVLGVENGPEDTLIALLVSKTILGIQTKSVTLSMNQSIWRVATQDA